VPGRASKLALAFGFVVVLALALGILQLTRSASQATVLSRPLRADGPRSTPRAPAGELPASGAPPRAASEPHPVRTTPAGQVTASAKRPELAPAQVGTGRVLKRDANGKLVPIIPLRELRGQFHLTDAPMKACIERSGHRPTGKATLSFTVGAKNNKLVIDTGVQDEETLAEFPDLLECMHQTAKLLVLDGYSVPELGTPIYVRRHVRLEDGVLAENSIFNFSYDP
jgi:hypothetical protein